MISTRRQTRNGIPRPALSAMLVFCLLCVAWTNLAMAAPVLDDDHLDADCADCHVDGYGTHTSCDNCHDDGRKSERKASFGIED